MPASALSAQGSTGLPSALSGAEAIADAENWAEPIEPASDGGRAAMDGTIAGAGDRDRGGPSPTGVLGLVGSAGLEWGPYEPAIRRWEHIIARPAPSPIDDAGRLSAHFVEWLMGLPAGWITDIVASRAAALRCLGNSVVPQVAELVGLQLLPLLAVA